MVTTQETRRKECKVEIGGRDMGNDDVHIQKSITDPKIPTNGSR